VRFYTELTRRPKFRIPDPKPFEFISFLRSVDFSIYFEHIGSGGWGTFCGMHKNRKYHDMFTHTLHASPFI